jgi:hypothetical protein
MKQIIPHFSVEEEKERGYIIFIGKREKTL